MPRARRSCLNCTHARVRAFNRKGKLLKGGHSIVRCREGHWPQGWRLSTLMGDRVAAPLEELAADCADYCPADPLEEIGELRLAQMVELVRAE